MTDTTLTYYTAHWKDLVRRYESANVSDLHALLADSFPPGARLLELGCGSGRDAAFMLENGFDVTASDGIQEMIDAATACHPVLAGRLCRIRLPRDLTPALGPFDGVYAVATLMHLTRPDIQEVFARIRRMLVPGGRLFFSVPLSRDDVAADEYDAKGRRFTALTRADWTGICRRSGFDILTSTITSDGLGRKSFAWLNCLVVADRKQMICTAKNGIMPPDNDSAQKS
ncbi:MAG: class I SAM-dependent methyltransferase [Desulfotignum sp.]|nr:class I SAM-dependent methyltransferase [Desulfotignum sp.]